ncbi:hypothetical protein PspLS_00016 [Pyricularia sp. CBS 133598]|nr:hypothetical protein PspLS_00016 [Pyricularia sp. CBS 133598]
MSLNMSTSQLPSNGTTGGVPPSTGGGPPPGFSGPPPGALGPCNFGENLGPKADAVSWTLVAFTTIFLLLRLYCKWLKSNRLWWDDWLLILSYMLFVTAGVIFSVNVKHGMGVHVCELAVTRPQELSTIALLSLVTGAISIMATIWSKTSFALTLLRITEDKWLKITLWTIVAVLNVSMSISAILTIVQCNPVQKSWDIFVDGYCWREAFSSYSVASAIYSGLTDVALALLPWTVILNLQMKLTEKIGVAVAMSAGVIAGAASFVKASHIPELSRGDFSYDGYPLVVWSAAEVALTIMAACIPVLRVLIRDVKNASKRYYGRSKDSGSGSGNQTSRGTTIWPKGRSEPSSSRRVTITNDKQQHSNNEYPHYQQQQHFQKNHRIYEHEHEDEDEHAQEQNQELELSYLSMKQPPRLSIGGSAGARRNQDDHELSDSWSQRNILNSDSEVGNALDEQSTHTTTPGLNMEPRPGGFSPGPASPWPLRSFEIDGEASGRSQMRIGRGGMNGRRSDSRAY